MTLSWAGSTQQLQVSDGGEPAGWSDPERPYAVPRVPLDPVRLLLPPAGPHQPRLLQESQAGGEKRGLVTSAPIR